MCAEVSRRDFLRGSAIVAGGVGLAASAKLARAASRTNMCGYAAKPLEKIRVGHIGLGGRGTGAVSRMSTIGDVEIVALCDLYEKRVERAQGVLKNKGRPRAEGFHGSEHVWEKLCQVDLDLVYVTTPWRWHAPMVVGAMINSMSGYLDTSANAWL